ncbi:hypothetical protein TRICI_004566 [Trichomonascus ciferrii]|uniref:Autophagy-related protein 3 n=1 Tax=Trichomonascus ciferrii TaxID=44093 RepID=A0A642V0H7_9ASCO|nr:hypothetical protein TRICI_004566 [Trichomonascus ciferrii]
MLRNTLSSIRELREYLTPVSHVSNFKTTGEITPGEFVTAGDYLVYKFPTWSWASAPPSKRRDFLPEDKQYLVTRHVPSHVRASAFTDGTDAADEEVDAEGWVTTSKNKQSDSAEDRTQGEEREPSSSDEPQEIVDIDLEEEDLEEEDSDAYRGTTTRTPPRTYNLYITYSTSYRVPKIYLSGFNANGGPLTPNEMFEDIVADYKDKTVTIERAPFEEDLTLISIHPCKHSSVMKVLLDRAEARLRNKQDMDELEISKGLAKTGLAESEEEEWEEIAKHESTEDVAIRVDQYLIIFLKFISSVTPGIEHDFTMTAL